MFYHDMMAVIQWLGIIIQSNYISKSIGREETLSHKSVSRLIQGVAKAVSTVLGNRAESMLGKPVKLMLASMGRNLSN